MSLNKYVEVRGQLHGIGFLLFYLYVGSKD